MDILKEGLAHFPEDERLLTALAVSLMNLGRFQEALELLGRWPELAEAQRLAEACRNAMGRS